METSPGRLRQLTKDSPRFQTEKTRPKPTQSVSGEIKARSDEGVVVMILRNDTTCAEIPQAQYRLFSEPAKQPRVNRSEYLMRVNRQARHGSETFHRPQLAPSPDVPHQGKQHTALCARRRLYLTVKEASLQKCNRSPQDPGEGAFALHPAPGSGIRDDLSLSLLPDACIDRRFARSSKAHYSSAGW